jgi:uncharacterized protein (TIGR02001 family)
MLAGPVAAQDAEIEVEFGGSSTFVSDYSFRGISQTLEDPAVQAGITGTAGPVYAGIWGSSLNFGEVDHENRAHAEVDVFGGVATSLGGVLDADLGVTYYAYPGTRDVFDYNFIEFALALSRAISSATLGAKVAYSPDYFAASGTGVYLVGSLGVDIPNTPLSLSAAVGHQSIDDNGAFGTPDYMDYSAGASLSVLGVSLGVTLVGTDIDDADCFGGSELCDSRVVFSLGL